MKNSRELPSGISGWWTPGNSRSRISGGPDVEDRALGLGNKKYITHILRSLLK